MILLPRQNLVSPPQWNGLSLYEQRLLLAMLAQEANPVYARVT